MGKRHRPRKQVEVSVRIFGTDAKGQIFSEKGSTVNVSQDGARVAGIHAQPKVDEVVGLVYGEHKAKFKVKWVGAVGSPVEGQIGLWSVNPEKPFWDFALPPDSMDVFLPTGTHDHRRWPRVKCSISVELNPPNSTLIRGKLSDICPGGCFVEMPNPLPTKTRIDLGIWLAETKVRVQGEVVSAAPGFGMGIRFLEVSSEALEILRRHLQTIA
jgi:hypothetical protein